MDAAYTNKVELEAKVVGSLNDEIGFLKTLYETVSSGGVRRRHGTFQPQGGGQRASPGRAWMGLGTNCSLCGIVGSIKSSEPVATCMLLSGVVVLNLFRPLLSHLVPCCVHVTICT